ncbi:MAG: hypothetical protein ACRDYD_08995 [Acidimicrobiales bacterium]
MSSLPRLLVIMGSGETSPTMTKTHREVLSRLGPPPVPAVLLDTPFGFQENADDIVARAQAYFAQSVGARVELASFRSAELADALDRERFLAQVRGSRWVFAGPGSPSYALRQWAGSGLEELLAGKLQDGGAVTFSSAAALTLGLVSVPVYEVYKVGEDPRWLDGLDLLSAAGLRAAVIPHYNNAEGGNHDTRYCYLGERRLRLLESQLPGGAFVLGVDEHTGVVMELETGRATVVGLGTVTIRVAGRSDVLASGTELPIAEMAVRAERLAGGGTSPGLPGETGPPGEGRAGARTGQRGTAAMGDGRDGGRGAPCGSSPLQDALRRSQEDFDKAMSEGDAAGAVRVVLDLDDELAAWSADTLQSDDLDRGRAVLRSMVVRLGELAELGTRDPRALVGPFVELLVELRDRARSEQRWEEADSIRDQLEGNSVEVRDGPQGSEWLLRG